MVSRPTGFDGSETSSPTILGVNTGEANRSSASLRRDKPIISCRLCRRRKVRCDRQTPCGTCSRRGLASVCIYGTDTQEAMIPRSAGTVHERIHQLESLVVSLMQQNVNVPKILQTAALLVSHSENNAVHNNLTSDVNHPQNWKTTPQLLALTEDLDDPLVEIDVNDKADGGFMNIDYSGTPKYVGSSHWAAVLDSIIELKDDLEQEERIQHLRVDLTIPIPAHLSSSQLLYGCQPATQADIISSIPPRPSVDRLVSMYFMLEIAPGILHSGQFLREYENFWKEPSSTSIVWIGLLFTIMCLGAQVQVHQSSHQSPPQNISRSPPEEPSPTLLVNMFRERIVQCLNMGNYTEGGPHVLETMIQYYMIEHFLRQDAKFDIWILLSMLIPISFRMGLHRDPKHFSAISPFAGEMRRRIWATIFQVDIGFSALAGLPRLIKPQQFDTEEPRKLWDSDFDEHTNQLPSSRPETEVTPVLYLLAKNRLISVGGIISDLAHDVRPYPYTELMRFEQLLISTRNSLPPSLQWRPFSQTIIQGPQIVMQRVYLELFFHKMQITLYKKYMSTSITQPQYTHAREVCLESAIKILEYQHLLDEETQIDRRLCEMRWTYASLLNHDFMLAASVLCFGMKQCNGNNEDIMSNEMTSRIQSLLTKSRDIWLRSSTVSSEALKAVQAVGIVLGIAPQNEEVVDSLLEMTSDFFAQSSNPNSWLGCQDFTEYFSLPSFALGMIRDEHGTVPVAQEATMR